MLRHPQALVGTTLGGKYRLDALLGAGAYGAVYRGWHLLLDMPVAVKVAFRAEGAFGKRFRREARTLMRLHHPHIVRVHDYDRDPSGLIYLVQEFVAGRTLKAVLAERGPLPPPVVVEIGCQCLAALGAAHAEGIVHRDVKLDNLMLAGELDPPSIRLLDFGVARLRHGDGDASELTQAGGALGTPAYMAPEQIRGEPEAASDLYAVGVTLFYLLTGHKPFPQRPPEVYIAHLQHPVPPLPPSVPAALAAVIDRALQKAPRDRYPSAAEMSAALRTALPVAVAPPVASAPIAVGAALPVAVAPPAESAPVALAAAVPASTTLVDKVTVTPGSMAPDSSQTSAEMQGAVAARERADRVGRKSARWMAAALASGSLLAAVGWMSGLWDADTAHDEGVIADRGSPNVEADALAAAPDVWIVEWDALVAEPVDATPPAPDVGRPPAPVDPPRPVVAQPRRPKKVAASVPIERNERRAQEALAACQCAEASRLIAAIRQADPRRVAGLEKAYNRKCLVDGLPGSCK